MGKTKKEKKAPRKSRKINPTLDPRQNIEQITLACSALIQRIGVESTKAKVKHYKVIQNVNALKGLNDIIMKHIEVSQMVRQGEAALMSIEEAEPAALLSSKSDEEIADMLSDWLPDTKENIEHIDSIQKAFDAKSGPVIDPEEDVITHTADTSGGSDGSSD